DGQPRGVARNRGRRRRRGRARRGRTGPPRPAAGQVPFSSRAGVPAELPRGVCARAAIARRPRARAAAGDADRKGRLRSVLRGALPARLGRHPFMQPGRAGPGRTDGPRHRQRGASFMIETAQTALPRLAPSVQEALLAGEYPDAFGVLGPHDIDGRTVLRALLPGSLSVEAVFDDGSALALPAAGDGLYIADITRHCRNGVRPHYKLRVQWPGGVEELEDPYAFGPLLDDEHLGMLAQGSWLYAGQCLGPRHCEIGGVRGVRFAVWAPNARRVALVGDFNGWNGLRHGMRLRHTAGVWEIFVPGVAPQSRYKFQILGADGITPLRTDPMARQAEAPPATASLVPDETGYHWNDSAWMESRAARQRPDAPLSVYELHVGSWLADAGPGPLWDRLADRLPAYARALGFTHIELMPVMEHPFGGFWGYHQLGMFAPSARYGTPADFARFVDQCHAAGLGVILDWVPAHFPNDSHGLAHFDGTALYEYADPREGFHPDWNTLVYNLERNEVKAFMIASALHWLREFHIDGLRVDAVASMLYRDYSRGPGEWIPNRYG